MLDGRDLGSLCEEGMLDWSLVALAEWSLEGREGWDAGQL